MAEWGEMKRDPASGASLQWSLQDREMVDYLGLRW
jgi:hypothetical protein